MNNSMRLRLGSFVTLGVAVLASGCSGGGQSSPSGVLPNGNTPNGKVVGSAKAQLAIKIPIRTAGAAAKSRRSPKYVSTYTAGLSIRTAAAGGITGSTPWQSFDVSGTSPACSVSNAVRTCLVSVTAPVVAGQMDEFQIDATDTAPAAADSVPTGNFLSGGDVTQTVVVGAANSVSVALTGIIGVLTAAPVAPLATYSVWAAPGTSATATVPITANDAAGGQIAGSPSSFQNPIAFTDTLGPTTPFTYVSANLNASPPFYGLPPPTTPGPIAAPIAYTAPLVGAAGASTTVTASTMNPSYLGVPVVTTTFPLDAMVVSAAGIPVGGFPNLTVGVDVPVMVNETGATNFTITANANGAVTLLDLLGAPLVNPVAAPGGTATFVVHPVGATAVPSSITVLDANSTLATLPVVVH